MTSTLSSNLSLRPDPAVSLNASTAPDAASGAAARAASNEPPMLREPHNNTVTTDTECAAGRAALGAACCADPQPPADPSDPHAPNDHPLLRLTPQQQQALELLSAGHSESSVCRRMNINRGALYRWKTTHPRFMAELSRRTALQQQSSNAVACRARDAALKIVLNQLRKQPGKSLDIAVRLLCSPQLTRLAAASRPAGLQDIIAQLQSARPSASTSPDDLAGLLTELNTEAAAPDLPQGPPRPQLPTTQRIHANTANRQPRPDLHAAFINYGCSEREITSLVRRPDLHPFDIYYHHYATVRMTAYELVRYLTNHGPDGIMFPLDPRNLAGMINGKSKVINRLGNLDLAGASARASRDALVIITPDGQEHLFPDDDLWRDFVLGWSCEPSSAAS